jgi:hypothetical protein
MIQTLSQFPLDKNGIYNDKTAIVPTAITPLLLGN